MFVAKPFSLFKGQDQRDLAINHDLTRLPHPHTILAHSFHYVAIRLNAGPESTSRRLLQFPDHKRACVFIES